MSDDEIAELRVAARALRRADEVVKRRREAVRVLVLRATAAKVPQKDIADAAGVTRETVRRIVDDAKKKSAAVSSAS